MLEIATVTAAIGAASSAIGLIDQIAEQVQRFIHKVPTDIDSVEHSMTLVQEDGAIVAKVGGEEKQRIGAEEFAKLPELQLRHILVLEKSMNNHYNLWCAIYPELALMSGLQKAQTEEQLRQVIRNMKADFQAILKFLEDCGLQLDDHYMHIRATMEMA